MAIRYGIIDRTNDDSCKRQDKEWDKYSFNGIEYEAQRLISVYYKRKDESTKAKGFLAGRLTDELK